MNGNTIITYESAIGSITFAYGSPFWVSSIDGASSVDIDVSESRSNMQVGSSIASQSVRPRIMTIDGALFNPVRASRKKLLDVVAPQFPATLTATQDGESWYLNVVPERTPEITPGDGVQHFQMRLHAAYPYWRTTASYASQIAGLVALFKFPFFTGGRGYQEVTGAIATVPGGVKGEPIGVTARLVATQSGTGDPSPDNVRPITGRDTVTITRYGATPDDNSASYPVALPQTLYGLAGAPESVRNDGVCSKRTVLMTLTGNENVSAATSPNQVDTIAFVSSFGVRAMVVDSVIASHFPVVKTSSVDGESVYMWRSGTGFEFRINRSRLATQDTSGFKSYLAAQSSAGTPVQVLYELASPQTLSVAPFAVPALDGVNNVLSDGGGDTTAETVSTEGSWWISRFTDSYFANVENRGNVPVEFRAVFTARSALSSPELYHVDTQKTIRINKDMVAGERVVVSTIYGEKSVIGTSATGETSNYFKYLSVGSDLSMELVPGANLLRIDAATNREGLGVRIEAPEGVKSGV